MGKREGYVERTENFLAALQNEKAFEVVDVDYVREAGTWYLRILCDMPGGIESRIVRKSVAQSPLGWIGRILFPKSIFLR